MPDERTPLRGRITALGSAAVALALALCSCPALAQSTEMQLDDDGGWVQTDAPEPGTDAWVIAEARRLLADDKPAQAYDVISPWIEANKRSVNAYLPEAYLIRGDARVANGNEYKALYDYEAIIRDFTASDVFADAVQREYEIGLRYLGGLRRKIWGMRIEPARSTGEELIIRVQERLPGSRLAEKAALDLAEHYYERRQMKLASEMYGIFIANYPQSEDREYAALRQIKANVARFKGPDYDGAGLTEARLLIEDFMHRYPATAQREGITVGMLVRIDESAASQLLTTARWYLRQGDEPAARFQLRRLLRKHPTSAAAREGVDIMIDRGWMDAPDEDAPPAPEAPPGDAETDGSQTGAGDGT